MLVPRVRVVEAPLTPREEHLSWARSAALDLSLRRGLGAKTDGLLRYGTSGLETGVKWTAPPPLPGGRWHWAAVGSVRLRPELPRASWHPSGRVLVVSGEVIAGGLLQAQLHERQSFIVSPRLHLTRPLYVHAAMGDPLASRNVQGAGALGLTSLTRLSSRLSFALEVTGQFPPGTADPETTRRWPQLMGTAAILLNEKR